MDIYLAAVDPVTGAIELLGDANVCTARFVVRAVGKRNRHSLHLCGALAVGSIEGAMLCKAHYANAMSRQKIEAEQAAREAARVVKAAAAREVERASAENARLLAEERSIIYYLRRHSDGMIKIGVTSNYKARFNALRREHGELHLLLAYVGSYKEEADAHRRFAAARVDVKREWFRPTLPLLLEIERRRNCRRDNRLPDQLGMSAIRALVKAARGAVKAA